MENCPPNSPEVVAPPIRWCVMVVDGGYKRGSEPPSVFTTRHPAPAASLSASETGAPLLLLVSSQALKA